MSIKATMEQKDVGMNTHQIHFRTHKKHQSWRKNKRQSGLSWPSRLLNSDAGFYLVWTGPSHRTKSVCPSAITEFYKLTAFHEKLPFQNVNQI